MTSEINEIIDVMKGIHFQVLESMNSKLTCCKGSAIADAILENNDKAPSLGIKKYAIADATVQGLFHQCCTVFYDLLPTREHYAACQRNSYCMGYLLPYFLNTGREALFLKYFTDSHDAWKQGENAVMQFLQDCTNEAQGGERDIEPVLADMAEPLWRQGNVAAERFFRLAKIVLVNQMSQESQSRVRLTALAFTSPRSDLNLDVLFAHAASVRPANRIVLAECLTQYKGLDADSKFRFLLEEKDDAVVAVALDAALRLFFRPIVPLAEAYLARYGAAASPALVDAVGRVRQFFQMQYPEYILAYGKHFLQAGAAGPAPAGQA